MGSEMCIRARDDRSHSLDHFLFFFFLFFFPLESFFFLLYTFDAADERISVEVGGSPFLDKKNSKKYEQDFDRFSV